MSRVNRRHLSDLRGATSLAADATVGITDLVEHLHHTIQLTHPPLGASRAGNTRGLTGFVYSSIRGVTRLVGQGFDAGLTPMAALLPPGASANSKRDALVSALNGVSGDHLEKTRNPLAIEMSFRHQGQRINPEQTDEEFGIVGDSCSSGKVMLFIHGLCLNEGHWVRDGCNQGSLLATDLDYTPVYLRYNTGLSIATNGRVLAGKLENLLHNWPVPVKELVIVGHSMGGLVARSACHHGRLDGLAWLQHLHSLVSVGTPHHGSPLGHGGNWLITMMGLSPYLAPFTRIGEARSEGIKDLRHGSTTDTDQEFIPLPADVKCYAMAATLGKKQDVLAERLIGDGLVPIDSALGKSKKPGHTLAIPTDRQWIGFETGHMELLGSPTVYKQLRDWLK